MPIMHLPIVTRVGHPRLLSCDDVAGDALEATRLRRVLHCVPAPGAKQASLGVPQASARHNFAHAGGG